MEITHCWQQYRRYEGHAADPQDDGEDVESSGERYVIHQALSRSIGRNARPRRLVTSSSLIWWKSR